MLIGSVVDISPTSLPPTAATSNQLQTILLVVYFYWCTGDDRVGDRCAPRGEVGVTKSLHRDSVPDEVLFSITAKRISLHG